MWKAPLQAESLDSVRATLASLAAQGCDLVRFAVPDRESAELLGQLAATSPVPLVADIHFDYRLALRCIELKVAKIRINPGTIGDAEKVREIVKAAQAAGACLRVGINAGSLPAALRGEPDVVSAMVKAAEDEAEILERYDFKDAVFSLKSSDVKETVNANRAFALQTDFPLHLGVTEAGPLVPGLVKSTLAIADLLREGFGDTIRVSLSASPETEVQAGLAILRSLDLRRDGVNLVSCPKCGRSSFDVQGFLEEVSDVVHSLRRPLTIAVMGCVVNGPGEAKKADLGISGAGKMAILFKGGQILRSVPIEQAAAAFREEVEKLP